MQQIGRYQILGELGRGAMGIVYKAQDPAIGRTIAIKSIRLQDLTDEAERARLRERLFREAQSAGMLSHPGIVTIYDIAEQEGMAYIFMEFVNGPPLEKMLKREQTPDKETLLSIFRQTAAALDYAHRKGIVHRDIKPANIMIHEDGTAKVTDFGVAKIVSQQMTVAGTMLGTPSYMPPEQVEGGAISGTADQFSLAVIAYEVLTGEKPFTAEYLPTLLFKIVREEPITPERLNPTLGPRIDGVLRRAMSKRPADRYETCVAFIDALSTACVSTPGWTPMPRGASHNIPTVGSQEGMHAEKTIDDSVRPRPLRDGPSDDEMGETMADLSENAGLTPLPRLAAGAPPVARQAPIVEQVLTKPQPMDESLPQTVPRIVLPSDSRFGSPREAVPARGASSGVPADIEEDDAKTRLPPPRPPKRPAPSPDQIARENAARENAARENAMRENAARENAIREQAAAAAAASRIPPHTIPIQPLTRRAHADEPSHVFRNVILAAATVAIICIIAFLVVGRYVRSSQPKTDALAQQPAAGDKPSTAEEPAPPPPAKDTQPAPQADSDKPAEDAGDASKGAPGKDDAPAKNSPRDTPRSAGSPAVAEKPSDTAPFRLTTSPNGAEATFDGSERCTTPCSVTLAMGRHTFVARLAGYRDSPRIIDIPRDTGLIVDMIRATGTLSVLSTPAGATVFVDGQEQPQKTPVHLTLNVGAHRIQVMQGSAKQEFPVEVHDGSLITRSVAFGTQ